MLILLIWHNWGTTLGASEIKQADRESAEEDSLPLEKVTLWLCWFRKITGRLRLEVTSRGHPVWPCHQAGWPPKLNQLIWGLVLLGLENLQGQRFHQLSGQSVPVLNHIHHNFFPPSFSFLYYIFCLRLHTDPHLLYPDRGFCHPLCQIQIWQCIYSSAEEMKTVGEGS